MSHHNPQWLVNTVEDVLGKRSDYFKMFFFLHHFQVVAWLHRRQLPYWRWCHQVKDFILIVINESKTHKSLKKGSKISITVRWTLADERYQLRKQFQLMPYKKYMRHLHSYEAGFENNCTMEKKDHWKCVKQLIQSWYIKI